MGNGKGNKVGVGEEERVIVDGDGQEQPAVDVTTPEMNCDLSLSFRRLASPACQSVVDERNRQPWSIPAMKHCHHLQELPKQIQTRPDISHYEL